MQNNTSGTKANPQAEYLQQRIEQFKAKRLLVLAHMASKPKHEVVQAFQRERDLKHELYFFIIQSGLEEQLRTHLIESEVV